VQQAAELSVAAPTITASLDGRYMSAIKEERVAAAKVGLHQQHMIDTRIPGKVHLGCLPRYLAHCFSGIAVVQATVPTIQFC
jgi:hypothetical protein